MRNDNSHYENKALVLNFNGMVVYHCQKNVHLRSHLQTDSASKLISTKNYQISNQNIYI